MGLHAQLLDDGAASPGGTDLFLANLVDMLVAGLSVVPSEETLSAVSTSSRRRRSAVG